MTQPRRGSYLYLALAAAVATGACTVEFVKNAHCDSDADCGDPAYPTCNLANHACRLAGSGPSDGGADMTVVACSQSSTCPAGAPVCGSDQKCGSCGTPGMSTECATYHSGTMPPTPLCGPAGACAQCLTSDQCDDAHLSCSPTTFTCVACKSNAECSSGLCDVSKGTCADKTTLLYTNNTMGAGCSEAGSGTFSIPFCSIQRGLNASATSGKKLIVFAGVPYAEPLQANTTISGGSNYVASAVGVGSPVIKPAPAGPVLRVLGTAAKQVSVTLDGFTFDSSSLTDGSNAIECSGSGAGYTTALTITRSTIKGAQGVGVMAQSQCSVTLDADLIASNAGGGISLATTDFALTNLLIRDNGTAGASGSPFGGIFILTAGESGKMNLFNATVVNNKAKMGISTASGIACAIKPTAITNTVVFGNQGGAASEIFYGDCGPTFSAFKGAATSGDSTDEDLANPPAGPACTAAELFVDPTTADYHPKPNGTRPCTLVDQGTMANAPDHDLDGRARPQGSAVDIGCYEH